MNSEKQVILSFAGDLCLEDLADNFVIDDRVAGIFKNSDLSVVNLEAPLTNRTLKTEGQPCYLKAPPENNQILELFDSFSLANNHILDYREGGFNDTCNCLKRLDKTWFGAGYNLTNAEAPLRLTCGSMKIALLGFTRWYNAKKDRAGTMPAKQSRLKKTIRKLKKESYFVVLYPHWNYEYIGYPSPVERARAHDLIKAGADLIIGSHPHQIQGGEFFRRKAIYYSLGNFVFPEFDLTRNEFAESLIVSAHINPDHSYSIKQHPVFSSANGLHLMQGARLNRFEEKLATLSLGLCNSRELARRFYRETGTIIDATMAALASVDNRKGGFWALLKRLPKAQRQDIYIQLVAIYQKIFGS